MLKDHRVDPVIPAVDLERAKAWYRDHLGLTPASENPGGATYELAGGTGFLLYPSQFAGTAQNTAMGFRVPDVEAEVAELRGMGVVFEEYDFPGLKTVGGIATMGDSRSAWFKDSEGNIIAVTSGMA